jgi:hypothetical protein
MRLTAEKDGYEVARSLLDGGPDIAVQDFMLFFMQWKKDDAQPVFDGCSFDPETGIMRVTDGVRSAIYKEVERRGDMVRMRWPD